MKEFWKNSLSLLLALIIGFSSIYVELSGVDSYGIFSVKTEAASESDLAFGLNDDGKSYSVISCNTALSGEISIPATYNSLPVTNIADSAFECCTKIISVNIPDSVVSIGDIAFNYCTNLTSVIIPNGVKSIGVEAFSYCTQLSSIVIPNSVVSLGSGVFLHCDNLESVTISNSIKTIEHGMFGWCKSLTSIKIPDGVTEIGFSAFDGCTNLESIVLPDSLTSIGSTAFNGCISLASITMPNCISNIGDAAFYNCTGLIDVNYLGTEIDWRNITIGKNNECLTKATIYYIDDILTFALSDDGTYYSVTDCNESASGEIIIPSTYQGLPVITIGVSAFENCESIISVVIPDRIISIGDWAFFSCKSLTSIRIPGGVTEIGFSAFENCKMLFYIYYKGTQEQWNEIDICSYNENLTTGYIHYESSDHIPSDWLVENEPTCYSVGSKFKMCTVCNEYLSSEIIPKTGHTLRWEITNPTCTTKGYKESECVVCGDYTCETIPETGHEYSTEWTIDIEPTCTVDGSKSYHCLACGDKTDITIIDATGHSYGDWVITKENTCTEEGSHSKTCSTCGDVITESLGAYGHTYSTEWTIDVEPTCVAEGSKSRHCLVCGEKTDITTIEAVGHNYEMTNAVSSHPHITSYKCSYCEDEKTETSVFSTCIECNFKITETDSNSYKLISYIGDSTVVVIPAIYNGHSVTTIANSCFKGNTTIKTVKIADGVESIGSLAFMNCTSLEKVYITDSVTNIGTNAFYGFNGSIYCKSGSYAHEYAVANGIDYVLMSIIETEQTQIDYEKFIIYTSFENCDDITEILDISENVMVIPTASYVYGNFEFYGTGTIVSVFDGSDYMGDFTLIVNGDTNGDSICDVLDCLDVERASNGNCDLLDVYAQAGDTNGDGIIDITDYQAVVNKAIS